MPLPEPNLPATDPHAPLPPRRRGDALAAAGLALLAVLVYANALRNGFALDDDPIILGNPAVRAGMRHLRGVLLGSYWPQAMELYRPVTVFTYAAEWAVHGMNPAAFHAVNLLLHAVVVVLLFALLRRLGAGTGAAALGAGVFAVHPLHVEAVANIVGRAELLSAIFFLLACLLYLSPRARPAARLGGVAALYLLALGAKEIAISLPAVLVVLDAMRLRGQPLTVKTLARRNVAMVALLVGVLGVYLAIRTAAIGSAVGTSPAPYLIGLGTARRLAVAVRLWPEYLRLLFWPRDLSADWGPNAIQVATWGDPLVWLGLLLGAAVAGLAVVSWREQRWLSVAVLWFALVVFPVSHIPFAVGVMVAERTLYLPSAGLAFLAPPLVARLGRASRSTRRLAAALGVVLLGLAVARVWTRTPVWKSHKTVFDSMLAGHPELWWVDWKAGEILVERGRNDEALPWFERAMRKSRYNHYNMNMAVAQQYIRSGQPGRAVPLLRHSAIISPASPPAYVYLSQALIDLGRYREAIAVADTALSRQPYGPSWAFAVANRKALAFDALGMRDSALAERRLAMRLGRGDKIPEGWFHYARLLQLAGDTAAARAALDSARAQVVPAYRPYMTLNPVPPALHPGMRGWVKWTVPGSGRAGPRPPAAGDTLGPLSPAAPAAGGVAAPGRPR